MKLSLLIPTFVLLLAASCQTKEEKEASNRENYETSKRSIEELEKDTPVKFLSVTGNDKRNLLGQTVVKGQVHNHAKMVTYKDVDIKLFFYSKTGALLQEDQEMIYENIAPGTTVNFKSKYFAPKGTDSIAMTVLSAKY